MEHKKTKLESNWKTMLPDEIEKLSFRIISEGINEKNFSTEQLPILKRVIHTSADFDYVENLKFSTNAISSGKKSLLNKTVIITDTKMVMAGINKKTVKKLGIKIFCFIDDEEVIKNAKQNNSTRAVAAINKAYKQFPNAIYIVGNAPTALFRICELHKEENFSPTLVIGVPVGFVNVVESKEALLKTSIPYITSLGRKGGSNIGASICNALIYDIIEKDRGV